MIFFSIFREMLHLIFNILLCCTKAETEFTAIGDWGYRNAFLKKTVSSMNTVSPLRDFCILLGDNSYPNGVSSVDDPKLNLFQDFVAGDSTLKHHVILGNHDYMQSVDAQIQYSARDQRWDLPSRFYSRIHDKDGVKICMLFIDTIVFNASQVEWVEQELNQSECKSEMTWRIVSGHYPIWSTGIYNDDENLKSLLLPILEANKVHLYLSGHEHLHEVFYNGKIVQVTSGAAADPRASIQFKPHDFQIWGVSGRDVDGFIRVRGSKNALHVSVFSAESNREFTNFNITRDGNKDSMFGHINWSYINSNHDANVAHDGSASDSNNSISIIRISSLQFVSILTSALFLVNIY